MTMIERAMQRMNEQPRPGQGVSLAQWPDAVHQTVAPAMNESRVGPSASASAGPDLPPPSPRSRAKAGGRHWTSRSVIAAASVCLPAVLTLAYSGGYRIALVANDGAPAASSTPALDAAPLPSRAAAPPPEVTPRRAAGVAPVDLRADAAATIRRWAAAWSERDVGRYLGFYAGQFEPPGQLSRSAWEEQRRRRILGKQRVSVVIEDLNVEMLDADRAIAQFAQTYEADDHRELRTPKTVVLAREENTWRIASETTQADAAARRSR